MKDKFVKPRAVERETKRKDSLKAVLKSNLNFFADSLLGGNQAPVQAYMKRYQPDTCGILTYKNDRLKENFEGIATVRKINGDKGRDSVVVIPPFNYCDEGDSYFFNDQKLPRLYTQSNCCHPNNLFVVEDIDEDGTREIGIFYSSCTSRFKALNIYSLQQNEWVKIAESTFDIFTKDPGKVKFNTLVRKIKKGEFKVCNFNDGKTTWETITMKAVLRR
ncbi:hypothetical protein [Mucilaginibacter gilvus]|uniref:Uncharacterized protein n=1 Tax=Mucilaginibacter gilvus TaxID=2305909 RepID=A0A3S3UJR1_9SPHI|nr:hypothetical protein [Mucilaginibacter gilvus]RWY48001.1 hypothetical protein EPL05_20650 [Mucilaginibacter gilvus]